MLSVKQRETNLKFLNFSTVKAFQQNYGLVADNIYGTKTDAKLIEVIKNIQSKIGTTADGMVGNNTIAKAKEWQKSKGLVSDGIFGNESRNWLEITNFTRGEFKCKCCGLNNINSNVVKVAQSIRNHFGKPVIVNCGTRCVKHNKEVGGVTNSRHLVGKAIDLQISGVSRDTLFNYAKTFVSNGKLRYTYGISNSSAIHIDIQ